MSSYSVLCDELVRSESEDDAVSILKKHGLWDDEGDWKTYGNMDNNWSIINNQQGRPENALVENLVNSADATLIAKCLKSGVTPTDNSKAPASISEALDKFYGIGSDKFSGMTPKERTALAERTCSLVSTGSKDSPCFGIIDWGEGQHPVDFEATFLSLAKSNKLSIPFVQGKFNQGSTGVLAFCGELSIKLIVSRRDPNLAGNNNNWGLTVIRRILPTEENGLRTSTAQYLAPNGSIAEFSADEIVVIPGKYPEPYSSGLKWGTYVKLFDYRIGSDLKTNILFDLNYRLSSLLVDPILPVRIYERRSGYKGHSFETTLAGLHLRLDEDRDKNVDLDVPISGVISTSLGEFKYSIYVLTKSAAKGNYTGDDGVIFLVNGQSHGAFPRAFFKRKSVGMSYLADSLIVTVDCSNISPSATEEVFQSSRDRLKQSDKTKELESLLTGIISENPKLKELRNKRRREELDDQVKDNKIAEDIFRKIIKTSPALNKVLIQGSRLSDPFGPSSEQGNTAFKGSLHPTFFRLKKTTTQDAPRAVEIGKTSRVAFETDAQNDYLSRPNYPGRISIALEDGSTCPFNYYFGAVLDNTIYVLSYGHYEKESIKQLQTRPSDRIFYLRHDSQVRSITHWSEP